MGWLVSSFREERKGRTFLSWASLGCQLAQLPPTAPLFSTATASAQLLKLAYSSPPSYSARFARRELGIRLARLWHSLCFAPQARHDTPSLCSAAKARRLAYFAGSHCLCQRLKAVLLKEKYKALWLKNSLFYFQISMTGLVWLVLLWCLLQTVL